jgi:light-independent protochlorophyllide reductase subunit B
MIERRATRPPVTYTTFEARDLGADTAQLFQDSVLAAYERFRPELLLVGASCTAELIQDDPGGLANALGLPIPVVAVELPAYQRKENWGAAETLYQITRACVGPDRRAARGAAAQRTCNILGPCSMGFRHRDDLIEVKAILAALGIAVTVVAPQDASPADLARLPDAGFNVVLYPEVADLTAKWLERAHGQPFSKTVPIGVGATREFIAEVAALANVDPAPALNEDGSHAPWWSRSVDSHYLTGKRVFVFGDATHACAIARVAVEELGFNLAGLGSYSREQAKGVRDVAARYGVEPLITDDYLEVEQAIASAEVELVLGGQMERHIAKRLGVPCAVVSGPAHVQDFPARRSPQMGFEGANVLFDTLVHPLMMGLEEHLLHMFRDDFEFNDAAGSSHLGGSGTPGGSERAASDAELLAIVSPDPSAEIIRLSWDGAAELELKRVPFFVRGKARRNTEEFAATRGIAVIQLETLYDARSHLSR